ncbi:ArsR/SmtB family transcription factor [Sporosalibacterium faouarense]|uniref:ArsR/SmtB family transcription factor n=1 Tax=Sporosalibacterium faouarense TaxID=516123 RepID=UPI00141C1B7A|nr:metalloregulator ArsR/SmtB family transcription factor [Sporosalibacterium faouarense]MTI48743.1 winged helix-turn-helix transcriptional regulator [Bacillota bacterium]
MSDENLVCNCKVVHKEIVDKVKSDYPREECVHSLTNLFKVLGDNTRVRIIFALFNSEMCVCDIAELLDMTQSAISHQLRVLRGARIVKYRKEGKSVFYSLDDDHIYDILARGLEHVCHE